MKYISGLIRRIFLRKKNLETVNFSLLEKSLGYKFQDRQLLLNAITHPSFYKDKKRNSPNNKHPHYQRLEFLGDSVLGCIIAKKLYFLYPSKREGFLSKAHSALSCGSFLSKLSEELGLAKFIRTGKMIQGGKISSSILEDVLEAIIGAIFLDSDYKKIEKIVNEWIGDLNPILNKILLVDNPKGKLQELLAKKAKTVDYVLKDEYGPMHKRKFSVEAHCDNHIIGEGKGASKREAEANAAKKALQKLKNDYILK